MKSSSYCTGYVMAGHSRSKNGVAPLAYVPAIHAFLAPVKQDVDARHKAGHDGGADIRCPFLALRYAQRNNWETRHAGPNHQNSLH
jgi:hypothetical protein